MRPWGLLQRVGVAAFVLVVLALGVAGAALADPSFTNPCSGDLDVGSCERLTFIANTDAAIQAQQVDDVQRLDLIWSGVWFVGGVSFGVWAFRRLDREMTHWGAGS